MISLSPKDNDILIYFHCHFLLNVCSEVGPCDPDGATLDAEAEGSQTQGLWEQYREDLFLKQQ